MLGSMSFLQKKLRISPASESRVHGREVPGEKQGQMDFHILVTPVT